MTTLPDQPVWELEGDLGLPDPGLLDPGPGALDRRPDRRPDVLVVGGGVTGLATAALCRRAGLGRVEVVERGRLAGGPSGRGGGILAPAPHHRTDPACLVSFGRASLDLWRQLSWEWEGELGLVPLDWLRPLPDGAPPASDLPPGAELLSPEDARDLEPRLGPGSGGLLVRDQARVHPLRLAAALARRAGAVATGVEVTGVERTAAGPPRVHTSRGDLDPGAVVLATGTAPSLPGVPPLPGQGLVKGTLVATAPAPFRLQVGVDGCGGLVFQLPDGRLVFGNTYDPLDTAPGARPEVVAATRADLDAVLRDAAGLPLSHAWSCFRPATADGLPVIDRVEELGDVWLSCGHFRTGFLMAAAGGQALANWIVSGERPAAAAPFAARRYRP